MSEELCSVKQGIINMITICN